MLTVIYLTAGVLLLLLADFLAWKRRSSRSSIDIRGIALQTVIILVVLIAIAGAIAAVLVSRGNQAVSEIQRTDITSDASDYTSEPLCTAAGFSWSGSSCGAAAAAGPRPSTYTDQATCTAAQHTWTAGTPGTCSASSASSYTSEANCKAGNHNWRRGNCT